MISKKAAHLQELLERNGLLKKAQEVTHKSLQASQPTIGNEMQKETEEGNPGAPGAEFASDKNVDAEIKGTIEVAPKKLKIEGDDQVAAKSVLNETGSSVEVMASCGTPTELTKSEALNQKLNAVVDSELKKQAAYQQQVDAYYTENPPTATETMHKIAALAASKNETEREALAQDIEVDFVKLAKYNPLFGAACQHIMMTKMAAEIDALADAEGIAPEQAAEALDAAIANDPEAAEEMNNEVEGEALSDLADAEGDTMDLMDGLDDMAAQASEQLGTEITSDDIIAAAEDVVAQAEEMGVEPEDLIQAAAEQMAEGDGEDITEEDVAEAESFIQAAAEEGISPEELLQAIAQTDGEGEAAPAEEAAAEEAPAEETAAEEPAAEQGAEESSEDQDMEKEACLKKLASTKRGANLAKILGAR